MTYKFAAFEQRLGGAKAGIRPRLLDSHAETMARYCDEIRPLVEARRFLTGADLGTITADFDPLLPARCRARGHRQRHRRRGLRGAGHRTRGDGGGRCLARRARGPHRRHRGLRCGRQWRGATRPSVGARVSWRCPLSSVRSPTAPASTSTPCSRRGLSTATRSSATSTSRSTARPNSTVSTVDVLVPGARPGVLHGRRSPARCRPQVVCPAANVPYTDAGLAVLRRNHVAALPDFVCNAGAVLAYEAPRGLPPHEVLGRVDRLISRAHRGAKLAWRRWIRSATPCCWPTRSSPPGSRPSTAPTVRRSRAALSDVRARPASPRPPPARGSRLASRWPPACGPARSTTSSARSTCSGPGKPLRTLVEADRLSLGAAVGPAGHGQDHAGPGGRRPHREGVRPALGGDGHGEGRPRDDRLGPAPAG